MNLKKIPVEQHHDTNQYSVAARTRPHEKKNDIQELKQVLLDTIHFPDRHLV